MSIEQQLAQISEGQIAILARMDELQESLKSSLSEKIILKHAEAARFLGISGNTLYKLRQNGTIKGAKYGREFKYKRSDLLNHLNSK